jgi:hypothetical protein
MAQVYQQPTVATAPDEESGKADCTTREPHTHHYPVAVSAYPPHHHHGDHSGGYSGSSDHGGGSGGSGDSGGSGGSGDSGGGGSGDSGGGGGD